MATYGPGIDQSRHAKSASHIINRDIGINTQTTRLFFEHFQARKDCNCLLMQKVAGCE